MVNAKTILHIDMDAFFASIEQHRNKKLKGKPVIIGADPKGGKGRGVVSTCSYEARKSGVRSAMPISKAYELCPGGIYLLPDMEEYCRVSGVIFDILRKFAFLVEPLSIDEAFLDISGSDRLFGSPEEISEKIKSEIFRETGLTASVGIAPNKFIAKIASEMKKPDGFVIVKEEEVLKFLEPLPISRIWGIGKKTEYELKLKNIKTIGDIQKLDKNKLIEWFGKNGIRFWEFSRGIDDRNVETEYSAKSISREITFEKDTDDLALIQKTMLELSENIAHQLRRENIYASNIDIKIRFKDFTTFTRSHTISKPTRNPKIIFQNAQKLFNDFLNEKNIEKSKKKAFRLIGVKATNFSDTYETSQLALFEEDKGKDAEENKTDKLYDALDRINKKYNKTLISLAALNQNNESLEN